MTRQDLIDIGFKEISHFTITNAVIYQLGRNRHLSAGCVGTPNEMVWICGTDHKDETKITDLICLHNYDYDGFLTKEKINNIINSIVDKKELIHEYCRFKGSDCNYYGKGWVERCYWCKDYKPKLEDDGKPF